ncbi:flagellar basal body L-ring protein FlgH [Sphingomonas sp.]|uniref:flagellar basal body L-ring protein FlgH n=1 Tax=Sphingomonas sp. TaxID=28214 RepID=UPI002DB7250C|nr:flagellar basal body L-ring protein FlgH [Sphingomonas sp.]HEU4968687.1 flagellar basal body L-ring protein FlgH [Sphingomonas sp.]
MPIRTSKLALALLTVLVATQPALARKKPKIDYTPVMPATPPPPPANGAIFQASTGYAALYEGPRARRVGDPLTIVLAERTVAQKDVGSKSGRDGSIGLTPPSAGPLSLFSPLEAAASGTQDFKGAGSASQSNMLSGEISVTVAQVFPNGTLLVRGEKQLRLNRGDETVQIQGIVRIADIDLDNRVLSTRVADAKISYTGRGDLQRQARPGWLQRFFSLISPF